MQRYTIYFFEMLYMFQAVPQPFMSSKLYAQHRVLAKPLLLPAAVVEELELPTLPRYRQAAVKI
jgi:hypothetical protein